MNLTKLIFFGIEIKFILEFNKTYLCFFPNFLTFLLGRN